MFGLLMVIALGMLLQATPSDPRSQLDETKAEVLGHGYSRDGDFIYSISSVSIRLGKKTSIGLPSLPISS